MNRIKLKFKINFRVKLISGFLFIVILTGVSSIIIGTNLIIGNIYEQAYSTVRGNLESAQYIYDNKINQINLFISHVASLSYIQQAIIQNDRALIIKKLKEVSRESSMDILNITDSSGRVLVRARNPEMYGDDVSDDPYIKTILREKKPCLGSDIMAEKFLIKEGKDLAEQAYIKVIPTQRARKRDKQYEERGLVIKAASPIFYNGRLIGIIYGARLLNKNYDFVDRIHRVVYKDEKFNNYEVGTSTIFLDDLRISTNVKVEGTRAIGTQVSEEVYKRVFEEGQLWLDKAFVVNNWYISAYSPIYNIDRKVIGILYVGLLEEKYKAIQKRAYYYYLLMILVIAGIAIVMSIYFIHNIINPYRALLVAAQDIANGIYNKKIDIISDDELGYLCKTFNKMVDAIVERDKILKEQTEKKMAQSEKLASVGRLASGIAHEINNPLTGVLTYTSLLIEDLKGSDYEDDLKVIYNETLRCRDIVRGILDFARETKLEKQPANINQIIFDSVSILEKHMNFQDIRIKKELSADVPELNLDVNQMKSVINNLLVNSADAMSKGGTISIKSQYDTVNQFVIIDITDTGSGIPDEIIDKIFDPFFTTKDPGKGTGLGLAVTYGIIKRHNGYIEVRSKVSEGTSFSIKLPVA
jgi:two-component system NtrC family sensor kinase